MTIWPGRPPSASWRERRTDRAPATVPVPQLTSNAVIQMQLLQKAWVRDLYPNLQVTGVIDGVTKAAIADFQYRTGLIVSGVVDAATEAALKAIKEIEIPGLPTPVPKPAEGRFKGELRGAAKSIVAIVGLALTLLTMIDGIGFIPSDAREIVAVMIAAITPIVVYFIPNHPAAKKGKNNAS